MELSDIQSGKARYAPDGMEVKRIKIRRTWLSWLCGASKWKVTVEYAATASAKG